MGRRMVTNGNQSETGKPAAVDRPAVPDRAPPPQFTLGLVFLVMLDVAIGFAGLRTFERLTLLGALVFGSLPVLLGILLLLDRSSSWGLKVGIAVPILTAIWSLILVIVEDAYEHGLVVAVHDMGTGLARHPEALFAPYYLAHWFGIVGWSVAAADLSTPMASALRISHRDWLSRIAGHHVLSQLVC